MNAKKLRISVPAYVSFARASVHVRFLCAIRLVAGSGRFADQSSIVVSTFRYSPRPNPTTHITYLAILTVLRCGTALYPLANDGENIPCMLNIVRQSSYLSSQASCYGTEVRMERTTKDYCRSELVYGILIYEWLMVRTVNLYHELPKPGSRLIARKQRLRSTFSTVLERD